MLRNGLKRGDRCAAWAGLGNIKDTRMRNAKTPAALQHMLRLCYHVSKGGIRRSASGWHCGRLLSRHNVTFTSLQPAVGSHFFR